MAKVLTIFDTDGVQALFDAAFLDFVNKEYERKTGLNPDYRASDIDSWQFDIKSEKIVKKGLEVGMQPGWFLDYLIKFVESSYFASLPVIPGSKEAVSYLKKGNSKDLFVVTDRVNSIKRENLSTYEEFEEQRRLGHKIQEDTILWYATKFRGIFRSDEIHFADGKSKGEIINNLKFNGRYNLAILVEDSYKNSRSHVLSSPTNYSFLLDRPYNQGQGIERVLRITGKSTKEQFVKLVQLIDDLAM